MKKQFDFKAMGEAKAQEMLAACMQGTPEQIKNQVEFVKHTGIALLGSIAFNLAYDGEELDGTKVMVVANEMAEEITQNAHDHLKHGVDFIPAEQ